MELKDILSIILTGSNFIFLIFITMINLKTKSNEKQYNKRKAWYNIEIFNRKKIDGYFNRLSVALLNKETSATEKCIEIDEIVADFNFNVIDYAKIIDETNCSVFKKSIMLAADELMTETLKSNCTDKEVQKLVETQRLKFLKLLFERDILGDLQIKEIK